MSNVYHAARPHMPFVVILLAGAIIAAFFLTGQYDPEGHQQVYDALGVVPSRFDPSSADHYRNWLEALRPLFGHMFVHFGWLHIFMNMLAFVQVSPFLARRIGGARYLILFFISGLGGALAYILMNMHADTPAVGASGAICGLFGAYFLAVRPTPQAALADPQVRNAMFSFLAINVVLMALLRLPIAWQAHLGGFIAGALAYFPLRPQWRGGPWG